MTTIIFGGGGMATAFAGISIPQTECDIRDIAAVETTMHVYEPNVVIVTAGVSNPGHVQNTRFEDEISVNLLGAFNVAQVAINYDVETMVFIASVAGLHGKPNHAAYSATKAGVISLVQSLAMEGYDAYAVSPGRVDTPMREKDYPLDTPGSRLSSDQVWDVIRDILDGQYEPGDNILIRKVGLAEIVRGVVPVPWKDILGVGQPVTI